MKHIFLIIASLILSNTGFAQSLLTKEQALQELLANNYNVKLAHNKMEIAQNNASIYNSGFLPSLNTSANAGYDLDNQNITFQDDTTSEIRNADTQTLNASIGLSYPLFTGFSRKYLYQQFKEQASLSKLETKNILESAILQVMGAYYQTALLTENTQVLKEVLAISKKRLERTNYQYKYGQTNKLAILNAQVDVDNDSIAYLNAKLLRDNSKRNLLLIMGSRKSDHFQVETAVSFIPITNLSNLTNQLHQNNFDIQFIQKQLEISKLNTKISKSGLLPYVGLNTSYGLTKLYNSEYNTTAELLNYGLNAGMTLSWNIFDGGQSKTKIQNAQIALSNTEIQYEQLKHQLDNELENTYYDYQNKRLVLQAQEQNLNTAQRNFERSEELFKIGRINSVEFRQAQLNLLNAQTAILKAKYEAKNTELRLLQLSGQLLDNYLN